MSDVQHSLVPDKQRPPRWILLVLLLVALAVRGRVMMSMNESLHDDPDGYHAIAWRLEQESAFSLVHQGSLGPTAYRLPLYPLLLSILEALPEPYSAIGLFHVLLGAGTVWGVWRLGELSELPRWASAAAAVLVTVDPILLNQSVLVMSETLAAFLATWTLVALARLAQTPSVARSIMAGAVMALCVLCRPTFLAWLVVVVLVIPLALRTAWRRKIALTSVFVAAAAVVIAPWPLRNWRQFGAPIITTTHGGYTLLLANNPSFYEYLRSGSWGSAWEADDFHEHWKSEERKTMRSTGVVMERDELAADRRAYELAWQNIRAEPAMFAYACLVRVGRLWAVLPHQPSPDESPSHRGMRYAVAIWYTAELAVAAFGLWTLGRRLLAAPWLWGMLLVGSFTLVHAFYWTDMRMRAPLVSVVALLAAAGVAALATKRHPVTSLPSTA